MPIFLNRPFADVGERTIPPDSDNNGFVNFLQGYTQDYEINLASGDPLAKAVERPLQNGLFYLLTNNMQFWQTHGFQTWFAPSVNAAGYNMHNIVVYNPTPDTPGSQWRVYRSKTNNNITTPPAAGGDNAAWEEIKLPSVERQFIPMPAGGDSLNNAAARGIVTSTGQNLNSAVYMISSTWEFTQSAVASAVNLPTAILEQPQPGMLEVLRFVVASESNRIYVIQRYTAANTGRVFVRSYIGNAWSNWMQTVTPADIQQQVFNLASCVFTVQTNTYALSPLYVALGVYAGMELLFLSTGTNTGAARATIGGTYYPIVGWDGQPLPAGAISNGSLTRIQYNGTAFTLMYSVNAPTIGKDATAPNEFVTKRQLDAVAARILSIDDIYPVNMVHFFSGALNPNQKWPGTTWVSLPDKSMIRIDNAANVLTRAGQDSYALTANNIPQHTHNISLMTSIGGGYNGSTSQFDYGTKPTSASGAHTHGISINTSASGSHAHTFTGNTGSTDLGTRSTNEAGAHQHRFPLSDDRSGTGRADGANPNRTDGYQFTESEGAHVHQVILGSHSHTFSGSTTSVGNHVHAVVGTTFEAGNHSHTVNIGVHWHNFTIPTHQHSVNGVTGAYGANGPVTNVPTLPVYVVLRGWYRTA